MTWTSVLLSGVQALFNYLSFHVLTCLVPAFFIAGAISSMVSKEVILKYFGPEANKALSYVTLALVIDGKVKRSGEIASPEKIKNGF